MRQLFHRNYTEPNLSVTRCSPQKTEQCCSPPSRFASVVLLFANVVIFPVVIYWCHIWSAKTCSLQTLHRTNLETTLSIFLQGSNTSFRILECGYLCNRPLSTYIGFLLALQRRIPDASVGCILRNGVIGAKRLIGSAGIVLIGKVAYISKTMEKLASS